MSNTLTTVANDGLPLAENDLYNPFRLRFNSLEIYVIPFERANIAYNGKQEIRVVFFKRGLKYADYVLIDAVETV